MAKPKDKEPYGTIVPMLRNQMDASRAADLKKQAGSTKHLRAHSEKRKKKILSSFHILRRMLVPKRDKLHLLPSELHNEDFEWIDVLQLCKDLHRNILEFLGATYAVLLSKFKNLIKAKR